MKEFDDNGKLLQIMAERLSDKQLNVDDCTKISHTASAILDVEDTIESRYNLEVSSPGIDRPLFSEDDYSFYKGHLAKLQCKIAMEGRKKFKGTITDYDSQTQSLHLELSQDNSSAIIAHDNIEYAQLVLTDALMAFEKKRFKKPTQEEGTL
mgnify:CR=1 FL=1